METNQELAKPGQYLTFTLRAQRYGVPISAVREINRVSEITSVPQSPKFMLGVINLRGRVIPVIDLRLKFGMDSTPHTRETCIIVMEGQKGPIGVIVDSVSEVIDLVGDQIAAPPSVADKESSFVMGMGKVESRIIILVDVVATFASEEIYNIGEVTKQAA